jgi:hypothetical protein
MVWEISFLTLGDMEEGVAVVVVVAAVDVAVVDVVEVELGVIPGHILIVHK